LGGWAHGEEDLATRGEEVAVLDSLQKETMEDLGHRERGNLNKKGEEKKRPRKKSQKGGKGDHTKEETPAATMREREATWGGGGGGHIAAMQTKR